MDEPIRYDIGLRARRQHLVEVSLTIPADLAPGARIVMATWTPGSYVIRDYVRHVQRIVATAGGDTLALTPDGRTAWLLPEEVGGTVVVDLELYANDPTVRTNHVDEHHALLVPPATLPYVESAAHRRHVVHLPAPAGEDVVSLLPEGEEPGTFVADGLLHLMDGAFEVGAHATTTTAVADVPHRIVWVGPEPVPDLQLLADDLTATAEEAVELFGGDLPVDDYTVIAIAAESSGGLEHRDGAVLQIPLRALSSEDGRAGVQSLLIHEYLHLWNVKRLVPAALTSPDLEQPTHSPSLWVAEGWTSYYDRLLPLRAGLWTLERFLDSQADRIRAAQQAPAATIQSVRDASWQAWVKHYVRDENTPNAAVDYYGHGAVLAWCLDLLIRREAGGGAGLDDALRILWRRFGNGGAGYEEADVEEVCAKAAGTDIGWLFDRYVDRAAVPPIEELLEVVGLCLVVPEDAAASTPWLGADTSEDGDTVILSHVLRGGPAWRAGLTGGDRLLAVDGLKVESGALDAALRAHSPGDVAPITVFRGPRLVTAEVELGQPRPKRRLAPVDDPSVAQQKAFRAWTGRDLAEA